MYNLFLDESGEGSLKGEHKGSPFFVLGGLIAESDECGRLRKYVAARFNDLGLKITAPFHSTHHRFDGTLRGVYDLIADLPVVLLVCALHLEMYREKYIRLRDPYDVAWECLCQRFQLFLKDKSEERGCEQRGQVIVQKRGGKEARLARAHAALISGGNYFTDFANVEKWTIQMKPEEDALLQLADPVVYAVHRAVNKNDDDFLNKIINSFRISKSGEIFGWGIIFFPRESREQFRDREWAKVSLPMPIQLP